MLTDGRLLTWCVTDLKHVPAVLKELNELNMNNKVNCGLISELS